MGYRDNKRSPRQKIQDFMSTPKGQTIMNYAYNWGASVVIMGTLFKLTHLPGANFMLFAGMGTEVLIFFLSAFDLSGVKRGGENVGTSVSLGGTMPAGSMVAGNAEAGDNAGTAEGAFAGNIPAGNIVSGGGPSIVVVQGGPVQPGVAIQSGATVQSGAAMQPGATVQPGATMQAGVQAVGQPFVAQPVQPTPPTPPAAPITPEMEEATAAYLEQLKAMTEMLSRCTEQAQTISQDTDQMNLLSKNLAGINAIYEMQLRSVSTQIGTIDQVHEQTRRMARQIEELNEVYARMLQAMTSK